jgi:hypothetical protein
MPVRRHAIHPTKPVSSADTPVRKSFHVVMGVVPFAEILANALTNATRLPQSRCPLEAGLCHRVEAEDQETGMALHEAAGTLVTEVAEADELIEEVILRTRHCLAEMSTSQVEGEGPNPRLSTKSLPARN